MNLMKFDFVLANPMKLTWLQMFHPPSQRISAPLLEVLPALSNVLKADHTHDRGNKFCDHG